MAATPLQLSDFEAYLGARFRLLAEGEPIELELAEASASGAGGPAGRAGFSLVFLGPPASALPQRTYRLEHPAWPDLDLFLVPIGASEKAIRYEAVFN